jgi:hypothetical protein
MLSIGHREVEVVQSCCWLVHAGLSTLLMATFYVLHIHKLPRLDAHLHRRQYEGKKCGGLSSV